MATKNYNWIDNPTESGVQDCNTDVLNECLMHLKYENSSGVNLPLFSLMTFDRILQGEEAQGWALQGTYVYKDAIAGSRLGYPDFYNKCLDEKNLGVVNQATLGNNTITMYINSNGHQFYDIADKDIVDNFYNTMGIAWFYGVDTENERVFLPRSNFFAVTGVKGSGMTLGLFDGTSNYGLAGYSGNTTQLIGSAQAYGKQVGSGNASPYPANKSLGLTTDPTKSGITLEPDENKYLYICVGNTINYEGVSEVVNQGMDILEQVNQGIESRVDINASNFTAEAKMLLSSYSLPSSKYVDLTFGASEATYTAPANGYFQAFWTASGANQYLTIKNTNNDFASTSFSVANSNTVRCWLPVRKNDVVKIGYSVGTKNYLRFYYAEGEV